MRMRIICTIPFLFWMALQVEEIGGFSPSFSRKMAKLLCKPDIFAPRIFQKNFERRKLSVKAQILKSQHVNQDRKRIEHNYMLREFEKFQIVNNSLTESTDTEMIPYANHISKKKTNDAPSPKSPKKKPKRKLPGAAALSKFLSQPMVELAEALLVVFSTLFVAIDTLDNLAPSILHVVESAGDIVAYIFFIIFGLRWYADAEQGPKYFAKPFVLVDMVVVILPIFLQILNHEGWWGGLPSFLMSQDGGLITLRLLRILRLQRVLTSMEHFANFQRALGVTNPTDVQPYKLQLARVILSVSTLLSVAAGLIYTTEHRVNPALPDYFSALYFGLTTITTVGFGDITPVTTGGKLVVCGSILVGVAVIPGQGAALIEALLESDKQRAALEQQSLESTNGPITNGLPPPTSQAPGSGWIDAITPCPKCGSTMHWADASYCWSCGAKLSPSNKNSFD